jgi:anti-sigma B factor antagonist
MLVLSAAETSCQHASIACNEQVVGVRFGANQAGAFMSLKINSRTFGDVNVIDCAGRIVFGDEASQLRETIKKQLLANSRIVLNLADVNYIDSGGIGTLVSLFTSARNAGGDIKLLHLTKRVGDLLQITKLITVFESYDDEQKAVSAFHSAPRGNVATMSRRETA